MDNVMCTGDVHDSGVLCTEIVCDVCCVVDLENVLCTGSVCEGDVV